MKLHIKNMVSTRCIMAVKNQLEQLGLHYKNVELGQVELWTDLSAEQSALLKKALSNAGFEVMDDTRTVLTERIKNEIIEMVYYAEEKSKINFSHYLSNKLRHSYNYLAGVFSEELGISIQQFIILCRTERIKEFLIYGELNVSEIAWKMNYSSVAHLSNQFKKVTGISPFHFKQIKDKIRVPIDELISKPTNGEPNDNLKTSWNQKKIITKEYVLSRYRLLVPEALSFSS